MASVRLILEGIGTMLHFLVDQTGFCTLSVMPRIRCARCPPVIRRRCHVMCLRVALCHVIICISYHVITCIALHTCSSHASELFPRCQFCNPAFLCPPAPPFASFCVWVLNGL